MKKALIASTVILLAIVICLFLAMLDTGLFLEDQLTTVEYQIQQKAIAVKALRATWIGRSEKDVKNFALSIDQSGETYKREGDVIGVAGLKFVMKDGRVISVGFFEADTDDDGDAGKK